ncbi:MAG: PKD domain-containing protein [Fibrobacter sp.]|nr:PKD domain-containing protein [Fibrobacter sp.]
MKKKLVFGASAICLSLGFWACGDGSIESIGADDDIARAFALDDEGLKELMKAAEKDCEADESCKSAQNDAYKSADDDDEDEESSDSDSGDSSASSSGSTAVSSSNVVVSSSGMVLSSSGAVVTSSAGATSSAGGTSSAQVTPVSSSSGPQITPASSSAVSSSSAAPATGPVQGICNLSQKTIEKGGSAKWSFQRMSGAKDVQTYKWTFSDGTTKTVASPEITYSKAGEFSAKVLINAGLESQNEIDCSNAFGGTKTTLKVNGTPITGCKCSSDAEALFFASGKPATATWTASGCTGGNTFTYTWGGDATGSGTSATGSFEKSGSFTPTLSVSNEEGMTMSATCPSVTVSQVLSASCVVGRDQNNLNSSSLSVMPGKSFSFKPKNISGFPSGSSSVSATLIGGGSETAVSIRGSQDYQNSPVTVTAPDAFGDYTYTLSANGIDICDAKVTVAVPNVACYVGVNQNSVSSAEVSVMPGQKFYFKPDGSGNSYWDQNLTMYMDLKGEGVEASVSVKTNNNSATSYSAPSSLGKYEYKLSLNGETLCSAAINVEYPKITSTSCDLTEHSWDHTHYFTPGASFSNWDANVIGSSFDMTLYLDDEVVITKSVSRYSNGDWAQITPPTEPGVHVYKLMFETNEVCSVEYEVKDSEE